jgi:hypothetical protein
LKNQSINSSNTGNTNVLLKENLLAFLRSCIAVLNPSWSATFTSGNQANHPEAQNHFANTAFNNQHLGTTFKFTNVSSELTIDTLLNIEKSDENFHVCSFLEYRDGIQLRTLLDLL